MSDHTPRVIARRCDVAVIGGSAAGLAAALQLGRQRRSVIVIDTGEPRNAPAAHVHSYLGREGVSPAEFAAITREEVRSYGIEVLDARAVEVTRTDEGRFAVELTGGHSIVSRRVIAATGVVDELPDIEGLAERWGRDVIHCPFCHGYEVRDRRLVQIVTHPMGVHAAPLFRQLSDRLTLVLHDGIDVDQPEIEALRASGVDVVDERVERVVSGDDGHVVAVELRNGAAIDADVVAIGTLLRPRVEVFSSLGLVATEHESGLGSALVTTPNGETSIRGLYAAGNVTDPRQQVLQAAAHGSWVGAMVGVDLALDDMAAAQRPTPNQDDWDHRYGGDQMWSGNPNGTLVNEITGLDPGRALDVGAGEGADAFWLAEQGWQATASDISLRALDRVAMEANRRELSVACLHADANDLGPFALGAFDLVTAHYASIPRTPDGRAIENLLGAVAPGGTLLVVGHDLEPMRTPIDTHRHSRPFDPDAYVRVDDVAEAIAGSSDWLIDVHEKRERPRGHIAASHHVDDIVLRARRARR
jgi:thioredoxin reductase/SAM-dependent methyltransferase